MVREAVEKSTLIRVSADGSAIAPIELPFDKEDTSEGTCASLFRVPQAL